MIIQGFLPVAIVYLTRILADSLVAVVEAGGSRESISTLLVSVVLMAIVMLLKELLSSLSNYIRTVQPERVTDYISDLRHRIAVLFQVPVHYYATVAENIAYGDLASKPGETKIKTASNSAGADPIIDRLPDNYDTLLGKWFKGGTDLSVGE